MHKNISNNSRYAIYIYIYKNILFNALYTDLGVIPSEITYTYIGLTSEHITVVPFTFQMLGEIELSSLRDTSH